MCSAIVSHCGQAPKDHARCVHMTQGPFSPVKIRNWYYAKKISGKVQVMHPPDQPAEPPSRKHACTQARFDFETELSNLSGVIVQIEQVLFWEGMARGGGCGLNA